MSLDVTCACTFGRKTGILHGKAVTQGETDTKIKSAQKTDHAEGNYPAAPAGTWTHNLHVTSLQPSRVWSCFTELSLLPMCMLHASLPPPGLFTTMTGLFPSLRWNYQNIWPLLDCFLPYIGITKTSDNYRTVSFPILELPKHLTTSGLFSSLYWNYQNIWPLLDCFLPYIAITKTSDNYRTVSFPVLELQNIWPLLDRFLPYIGITKTSDNYRTVSFPILELPKHLTTSGLFSSLYWNYQNIWPLPDCFLPYIGITETSCYYCRNIWPLPDCFPPFVGIIKNMWLLRMQRAPQQPSWRASAHLKMQCSTSLHINKTCACLNIFISSWVTVRKTAGWV